MGKEKWKPRPINAVRNKKQRAWQKNFRKKQAEAMVKAEALLKAAGLTESHFDFLITAFKNRRGPRKDQIDRIDKMWKKLSGRLENDKVW